MEIPASSFKLRANVPVGRKRFPIRPYPGNWMAKDIHILLAKLEETK